MREITSPVSSRARFHCRFPVLGASGNVGSAGKYLTAMVRMCQPRIETDFVFSTLIGIAYAETLSQCAAGILCSMGSHSTHCQHGMATCAARNQFWRSDFDRVSRQRGDFRMPLSGNVKTAYPDTYQDAPRTQNKAP